MVKDVRRETKKLRVAAYCRSNNVGGFDFQIPNCEHRINSNPDWILVGIYYDRGKSGLQINEQLKQLLEDCETGKIDLVFVKSMSRLSRRAKISLEIIRRLNELGIPIIFDKEGLNTMEDSEILKILLEESAKGEEEMSTVNWAEAFLAKQAERKAQTERKEQAARKEQKPAEPGEGESYASTGN